MQKKERLHGGLPCLSNDLDTYCLNKQELRKAVMVRYDWAIPAMPSFCACSKKNSVDHALLCKKGGYPILRHNTIRDAEAITMKETGCIDVKI